MAELLEDDIGRPKPQYEKANGTGFEAWKGKDGHGNVRSEDGQIFSLGSIGDSAIANTVIGRLKNLVSQLPAALTGGGNLKVGVVEALPAGTNSIGKVAVTSLPALPSQYPADAVPWSVVATSDANSAADATKAGEQDKQHFVAGYLVALRGAAAAGDAVVEVKSDTDVIARDVIGEDAARGARAAHSFFPALACEASKDALLAVGAAGAGAITELTIYGYTLPA